MSEDGGKGLIIFMAAAIFFAWLGGSVRQEKEKQKTNNKEFEIVDYSDKDKYYKEATTATTTIYSDNSKVYGEQIGDLVFLCNPGEHMRFIETDTNATPFDIPEEYYELEKKTNDSDHEVKTYVNNTVVLVIATVNEKGEIIFNTFGLPIKQDEVKKLTLNKQQ